MEGEKKAAAVAEDEVVVVAAGDVSLKDLSKKLNDFARERDWEQYHSPRNLLLAMVCILLSALYILFSLEI
jgi:dCTP diphosphatase